MTLDERLTTLKVIVGGTDTDEVLSAYLNLAGAKINAKAYPYTPDVIDVPSKYHYLQVEIAAYMLNKRGAEGQMAHSENGISRTYENADVPASMLKSITPYCGTIK
jgi:hypothetical protein